MSPTIRSKGGQPLFIGGQVAGADRCCECGSLCPGSLLVTARFAEGGGINDGDANAWCQGLREPYYYPAFLQGPIATDDGQIKYLGRFIVDEQSGADVSLAQVEFFIPRTPRNGSKARLEIRPGRASWSATYEADYIECPNCKCSGQLMYEFKPSDLIGGSSAFCGGNVEFVVTGSCWRDCEDLCAYKMGVVQPDDISVSADFFDQCNTAVSSYIEKTIAYSLEADLPSGTAIGSDIATSLSQGLSTGGGVLISLGGGGLQSAVRHLIQGFTPNTSSDCTPGDAYYQADMPFVASCGIGAEVFCTNGRTPNPFSVRLSVSVNVNVGFTDEKLNDCGGSFGFGKSNLFELDSLCQTDSRRHCYPITMPYRVLVTPVEFSATASTTSLGAYSDGFYESRGTASLDGIAASIGDALKDALTATFRITSRSSCRTVPADCDVPIGEGNTRVFWGGETPEFVLGTPELVVTTDPVTNDLLHYEHLAGGSGTAVHPYQFFFQRTDNPNTGVLEQQYVDLYCESDNNVNPPVTAWYVVHQTFKYCGGFTWDQWAGTIDTYAAPENCVNISAGDPVPIGEPTMERSSGYPILSAGGCGDPAPRIRFELEAPCGG